MSATASQPSAVGEPEWGRNRRLDSPTGKARTAPVVKPVYALYEFALTTVLLFVVVSAVRWLMNPTSPIAITDIHPALAVVGLIVGITLLTLIRSRWGRRSGAHLNPAVSIALWLMRAFPGRAVLPYTAAQLAGSFAGAALAGAVWGNSATTAPVRYAAVAPAPGWNTAAVFTAEAGCLLVITLLIGYFLANPAAASALPFILAAATVLIIALLGPLSGGSTNPARQLGPALLSGQTGDLTVYMFAPLAGAACGAAIHHLLVRRASARRPNTFRLCPASEPSLHLARAVQTPEASG